MTKAMLTSLLIHSAHENRSDAGHERPVQIAGCPEGAGDYSWADGKNMNLK